MTTILETALGTIRRHAMARAGDRVLVAVSGGPDSVALLHVLRELASELPLELAVAHLDHGLRGRASEEDREFVGAIAQELGLPFLAEREDVAALARAAKRSLEDAGRIARRRFLRLAAEQLGARRVALGHHRDDLAETVLMRLAAGTGRGGLSGIAPVSGSLFIRPLLDCSREELLAYLDARSIRYRSDATNEDTRFLRNRIRATVMPLLREQLNPRLAEAIARTAEILRDEDRYLDRAARRLLRSAASGDAARPTVSGSRGGPRAERRGSTDARPVPGAAGATGTAFRVGEGRASAPSESPDHGEPIDFDAVLLASAPRAIARRTLRIALRRAGLSGRGFSFDRLDEILDLAARRGSNADLTPGGGLSVRIEYGRLLIEHVAGAEETRTIAGRLVPAAYGEDTIVAARPQEELAVPGEVVFRRPSGPVGIRARVVPRAEVEHEFRSAPPGRAYLDADRLAAPLLVRPFRAGDRLHPLGGPGTRKLSDLFTDLKVPSRARRDCLIVDSGGEIAWVVGLRIAEPFKIGETTSRIAVLEELSPRPASVLPGGDLRSTPQEGVPEPVAEPGVADPDLADPGVGKPPLEESAAPRPGIVGPVLYSAEEIAAAVDRLAAEVSRWAAGGEILVLGVLQGSFIFLADLARRLESPVRMGFLDRRGGPLSSSLAIEGARVLLVEDILDTGESLARIVERLRERSPAEIRTCILFDKPSGRTIPFQADFTGLIVPDRWVVGYGLDQDGRYRNLPYLTWITGNSA